ncbi:MAG TPA: hypothetical protein VGA49_03850, partial [Patescibacteria group bacterium]
FEFTRQILQGRSGEIRGDEGKLGENFLDDWKLLGQVRVSYLIVESRKGLIVIDQHAAAERVLYDKLKNQLKAEQPRSQKLLLPINLELSAVEVDLLKENQDLLGKIGFMIDEFGGNSFNINAVPADISQYEIKKVLLGVISDLEDQEFRKTKIVEEKQDIVIKYTACRSAIKFNDQLTWEEQIQLLKDIKRYNVISCPHGRPCLWEVGWSELEKKFKR